MKTFQPEPIHLAPLESTLFDADVVEVPLMLTTGQATALENIARRRGLTAGQLLRRLLRDFLAEAASRPLR